MDAADPRGKLIEERGHDLTRRLLCQAERWIPRAGWLPNGDKEADPSAEHEAMGLHQGWGQCTQLEALASSL